MHPIKDLTQSPRIETQNGTKAIFCPIRRKWYQHSPEEEARQRFIIFLIEKKCYTRLNLKLEHRFSGNGSYYKADIIILNGSEIVGVVECKKNEISLNQSVFDQVNTYNAILKAEWVVVTNGLAYTVRRYDKQTGKLLMTEDLPPKSWHSLTLDEYAKQKIALENQLFELQRLFIAQHCPYKVGDTIEQEGRLQTITKITLQDPLSLTETYTELSDKLEKMTDLFKYELQASNNI